MVQPEHGRLRVPEEVRRAIQESSDSIRVLAKRYGLNPKTVAKWRARPGVEDRKAGPKDAKSSVLSAEEEAIIIAFRRYLPLPLDDCFRALQLDVTHLTRSSLHRCLQRYGVSRLPDLPVAEVAEWEGRPGCFHIHIFEVHFGGGKLYLYTAVDQASKYVFARILERASQVASRDFLIALMAGAPCEVREVLTDDRMQFTMPGNSVSGVAEIRRALEQGELMRPHPFEYACAINDIAHRLVPASYPWNAAQADNMGRVSHAIEMGGSGADAASELVRRVAAFLVTYNGTCHLGVLGGLTPYEYCRSYAEGVAGGERHQAAKAGYDAGASVAAPEPAVPDLASADLARADLASAGKPGERRSRGTREAILEAARSRLAKDGPEGLRLSEVARLAGVNRGTAYQHFKTRDNLIAATSEWVSDKLYRAVFGEPDARGDRPVQPVDPAELVDRLANFAMDNPDLSRAWLLQVLSSPNPARDPFWREYQGLTELFARTHLAQDGIDTEVLSVIMLAGAFLWPVWARTQAGDEELAGEEVAGKRGAGEGVDLRPLAHRFAQECLRISMYGNLRSEHYPQIAARLHGERG